jgi:DNA-binding GntR family transcriptional regulator
MSPEAVTAERAYAELKRTIMSGRYPPGATLNIPDLAEFVGASITPVRDALQRLVAERLVRFNRGGGYLVAPINEPTLRDLYAWHGRLVRNAVRAGGSFRNDGEFVQTLVRPDMEDPLVLASASAEFFGRLGEWSGSAEHVHAIRAAGDRLHAARVHEADIKHPIDELRSLWRLANSDDHSALRLALSSYHRRRVRNAGKTIVRMALLG